jgi:hypothetical protein
LKEKTEGKNRDLGNYSDLANYILHPDGAKGTSCVIPRTGEVIHELKIWPKQFEAVVSLHKTHEVRKNDRCFISGDRINLREYDPDTKTYTGQTCLVLITHVTPAGSFGLPNDLCVLSIKVEEWALPNAEFTSE